MQDFRNPSRRFVLAAGALSALPISVALAQAPAPAAPPPASPPAPAADPRMAERSVGNADAKAVVDEWFSLTCSHCAAFAREVFPQIRTKLIETGKLRYVFNEYPLNQLDLTAIMVARSLPADRYEPFVFALLESQAVWAFDHGKDSKEELAKMAALAGMPRAFFDAAIADNALRDAILAKQQDAETKFKISSTPTFVVGGKAIAGEKSYDEFVKMVSL